MKEAVLECDTMLFRFGNTGNNNYYFVITILLSKETNSDNLRNMVFPNYTSVHTIGVYINFVLVFPETRPGKKSARQSERY